MTETINTEPVAFEKNLMRIHHPNPQFLLLSRFFPLKQEVKQLDYANGLHMNQYIALHCHKHEYTKTLLNMIQALTLHVCLYVCISAWLKGNNLAELIIASHIN